MRVKPYLLPACLVLAGCNAVSSIKPSFGDYAEIQFEYSGRLPAVSIDVISKGIHGREYGPYSDTFYVQPGFYTVFAVCNRPPPPEAGDVIAQVGTADAPNRNYTLNIDSPGVYRLDCDYKDHKMELLVHKLSDTPGTGLD